MLPTIIDMTQLNYCVCIYAYHFDILRYVLDCTTALQTTRLTISVYVRLEVNFFSKYILLMNTNEKLLTIASPWIVLYAIKVLSDLAAIWAV